MNRLIFLVVLICFVSKVAAWTWDDAMLQLKAIMGGYTSKSSGNSESAPVDPPVGLFSGEEEAIIGRGRGRSNRPSLAPTVAGTNDEIVGDEEEFYEDDNDEDGMNDQPNQIRPSPPSKALPGVDPLPGAGSKNSPKKSPPSTEPTLPPKRKPSPQLARATVEPSRRFAKRSRAPFSGGDGKSPPKDNSIEARLDNLPSKQGKGGPGGPGAGGPGGPGGPGKGAPTKGPPLSRRLREKKSPPKKSRPTSAPSYPRIEPFAAVKKPKPDRPTNRPTKKRPTGRPTKAKKH